MEEVRKVFGRNVQKYRTLKGWTQAELAEKIDISPTFMMHIEHGTRGVSMETIELIARCFEIPYSALFEESASPKDFDATFLALEKALCTELQEVAVRCINNARNAQ